MAIFKEISLGADARRQDLIITEINYVLNRNRHIIHYFGGYNILMGSIRDMIDQFYAVRHVFGKYHEIPIRHYMLSFSSEYDEATPYNAYRIGDQVAKLFRADYQVLFAVHEEKQHPHIHFLVNTADIHDGRTISVSLKQLQDQIGYILALPSLWSGKRPIQLKTGY